MLDVSKLLFMSDKDDVETAKKDFGINVILDNEYIVAPFNKDYYIVIRGSFNSSWNINNYVKEYKGNTQIWLVKKFADINIPNKDSYYIFSDADIKKFDGILKIEDSIDPISNVRISLLFEAKDHSDIDTFHNVICGIFGINESYKRSIMYDPNYDLNKDGCFCRVCNKWYHMAMSDGLSDNKMNCWLCKTYRFHLCRKAITSLQK